MFVAGRIRLRIQRDPRSLNIDCMPETVVDAEQHTQHLIIPADVLTQSPTLQEEGMGRRGEMRGQRTCSPGGRRRRGWMAKGRRQGRGTWGAPKNLGLLDGLMLRVAHAENKAERRLLQRGSLRVGDLSTKSGI